MKTFRISAQEILYYGEEEIEAENKEKAKEIYMQMLNDGGIEAGDTDFTFDRCEEHVDVII